MTTGWRVSADVVWAGDDAVRLYNAATGQFQSFNGTASEIWCLMASGKDTHQIAGELTDKLAGGDSRAYQEILSDIQAFLLELAEQRIVLAVPADSG
jgi:hypothetical protein